MSLLRLKDIIIACASCGKMLPLAKMQQHILDEHVKCDSVLGAP